MASTCLMNYECIACPHPTQCRENARRRIRALELELWLLLGDVKARAVSCSCHPPLTKKERANIERAESMLASFVPSQ